MSSRVGLWQFENLRSVGLLEFFLTKPANVRLQPRGVGGGAVRYRGGRTHVTYLADEVVFFKTFVCPRFVKEWYFFVPRYGVWGGGKNPLTINEISAALTPSNSRSDWASESGAAKQTEDYKI